MVQLERQPAGISHQEPSPHTPRIPGGFPARRPRRLRRSEGLRQLVRETHLDPADFIYPLFVSETISRPIAITSMPGQFQYPLSALGEQAMAAAELGLGGVLLFGIPEVKDELGSGAYAADGVVQRAIRAIKDAAPDLLVVTDVCLCEYTSHGHCGFVRDGEVQNDETLELLAREAVSHAAAGADVVAPSDMMDGRVAALRDALDAEGYATTPIMAYSAKFARARHPGRRGYRHGEASLAVSGRAGARARPLGAATGRLQCQRRVRHAEGRCRQRLAGRAACHAGDAYEHQARRRRHHHHLPRARRRPLAGGAVGTVGREGRDDT